MLRMSIIKSPVLRTRSYVLRTFLFFLPSQFLRRPSPDILETFPHDVASNVISLLLCSSSSWQDFNLHRALLALFLNDVRIFCSLDQEAVGNRSCVNNNTQLLDNDTK